MKTWIWIVIFLIIIFVIVPLIAYSVTVNAAAKVGSTLIENNTPCDQNISLARPPLGKKWECTLENWVLVNEF